MRRGSFIGQQLRYGDAPGIFDLEDINAPAEASVVDNYSSASGASSISQSISLGAPHATRRIIVPGSYRGSGVIVGGATIAGVPANVVQAWNGLSNVFILDALVPAGTSGTLAISFSGSFSWVRLAALRALYLFGASKSGLIASYASSIPVKAGGLLVASHTDLDVVASTWGGVANLTETHDDVVGDDHQTAVYAPISAAATITLTNTRSGSSTPVMVAASFR